MPKLFGNDSTSVAQDLSTNLEDGDLEGIGSSSTNAQQVRDAEVNSPIIGGGNVNPQQIEGNKGLALTQSTVNVGAGGSLDVVSSDLGAISEAFDFAKGQTEANVGIAELFFQGTKDIFDRAQDFATEAALQSSSQISRSVDLAKSSIQGEGGTTLVEIGKIVTIGAVVASVAYLYFKAQK